MKDLTGKVILMLDDISLEDVKVSEALSLTDCLIDSTDLSLVDSVRDCAAADEGSSHKGYGEAAECSQAQKPANDQPVQPAVLQDLLLCHH